MKNQKILDLEKEYDIDFEEIFKKIKNIKKNKAKVLFQFPDGLKNKASAIIDYIQEELKKDKKNIEIKIWFGSCYGACDIPNTNYDLLIQFGHAEWK
jgi:2-(3-amino-3-carboxypropyl)histidine synthase